MALANTNNSTGQSLGSALTTFTGTDGNDFIFPEAEGLLTGIQGYGALALGGNDRLLRPDVQYVEFYGGDGIDTVCFFQPRSDYTIEFNKGVNPDISFDVKLKLSTQATPDFIEAERMEFSDGGVAFDLNGNAGIVARIIGAVFGANTVNNREYVGIGLAYLDSGMSYQSLVELAIGVRLGPGYSNADVVNLLYTNVAGVSPSETMREFYVGALEQGYYTVGTLGVFAAQTSENAANVNLIGLAVSGLDYWPAVV